MSNAHMTDEIKQPLFIISLPRFILVRMTIDNYFNYK